jgi:hypothetical protein
MHTHVHACTYEHLGRNLLLLICKRSQKIHTQYTCIHADINKMRGNVVHTCIQYTCMHACRYNKVGGNVVYIQVRSYMHTIYIHMHTYIHTATEACAPLVKHTYILTCIHTYMQQPRPVSVSVRLASNTHVYIYYIYIYIYIYINIIA